MIQVNATVQINLPAKEVFAFLAEWENNPRWQKGMKSCRWTSEAPLQVGSSYDQEASFMGKSITSSFIVVEYEPGAKVRIQTTTSTMPLALTRQVTAEDARSTRVSAIVQGGPAGFMRMFDPLMKLMVQRSVRRDYRRLKALLEGGG